MSSKEPGGDLPGHRFTFFDLQKPDRLLVLWPGQPLAVCLKTAILPQLIKEYTQKMQMDISRSEKKRQAVRVEKLAGELADLSPTEIRKLPVDDFLKQEILALLKLQAGARKRQIKFIAKELREHEQMYHDLSAYLAQRKGSRIREKDQFHELENLRQAIITDAISALEEARAQDLPLPADWPSPSLEQVALLFPALDLENIRVLASRFARTRKIAHSREIFRQLKSARERKEYQDLVPPDAAKQAGPAGD
jgi:ribosome-associated protein